jgi:hypothetical protein
VQWWPIAKSLSDHLKTRGALSGFEIYTGTKGDSKTYPCIEVRWDDESAFFIHRSGEGTAVLWADVYVRLDNVDPGANYEQQYMAQVEIVDALFEWPIVLATELGLEAKISVDGVVADEENNRPTFGSRMIIKIKWRKRG